MMGERMIVIADPRRALDKLRQRDAALADDLEVGRRCTVDAAGNRLLTPDCATLRELEFYIDSFKRDPERIRKQARTAFDGTASNPPPRSDAFESARR